MQYHQSFMHIAYCCALLCSLVQLQLLQQQQQPQRAGALADAVTIIIDGASTNEWATRDEYRRLVEQASLQRQLAELSETGGGGGGEQLAQQQQQAAAEALDGDGTQERALVSAARNNGGGGGAQTISDLTAPGDQELLGGGGQAVDQLQALAGASGALLDPLDAAEAIMVNQQLRRGIAPKRYCGPLLMEALELICDSRFFDGKELQVSQPIIRNRRYANLFHDDNEDQEAATSELNGNKQQQQQQRDLDGPPAPQQAGRRRVLRKLRKLEGARQTARQQQQLHQLGDNDREEFNHDGSSENHHNHQHQHQQYLSPSSSLSSSSSSSTSSTSSSSSLTKSRSSTSSLATLSSPQSTATSPATAAAMKQQQQQQQQYYSAGGNGASGMNNFDSTKSNEFNNLNSFQKMGRRQTLRRIRGAHKECCLQPCDGDQLKAFCARKE